MMMTNIHREEQANVTPAQTVCVCLTDHDTQKKQQQNKQQRNAAQPPVVVSIVVEFFVEV